MEHTLYGLSTDWRKNIYRSHLQNVDEILIMRKNKGKIIYPPNELVFNAFNHFDQKDLKVVILGQDCYHGDNQANGLAFSVNEGVNPPPSLRNILKEMNNDLGINRVNTEKICA